MKKRERVSFPTASFQNFFIIVLKYAYEEEVISTGMSGSLEIAIQDMRKKDDPRLVEIIHRLEFLLKQTRALETKINGVSTRDGKREHIRQVNTADIIHALAFEDTDQYQKYVFVEPVAKHFNRVLGAALRDTVPLEQLILPINPGDSQAYNIISPYRRIHFNGILWILTDSGITTVGQLRLAVPDKVKKDPFLRQEEVETMKVALRAPPQEHTLFLSKWK